MNAGGRCRCETLPVQFRFSCGLTLHKNDRLPRQAQDTHQGKGKSTQVQTWSSCIGGLFHRHRRRRCPRTLSSVCCTRRENGPLSHLDIQMIFLPRQARDKHRESITKETRFLAGVQLRCEPTKMLFFKKPRCFAKTGSGPSVQGNYW